ncbi:MULTISPECIES: cbb3-type cytochrome oxidase assembly protein CcoS [unclassified Thioalkalivibrio]|uniref:cbb3-type cytochrome oxidase assembly protein CcoS n=1 Tax=unclassified Thioalkalivibrio TaxID=2621013 RepID=UPI000195A529|nr:MULTISPECIES: cbb3-type cytochrome oxidase assembly protein CcoS [unclassified Thioalkalivibrio]ADC70681.1 cytochrome oxidase maturation protein, cbb3-type [Thioalkalivibrio sp. K90mix]
MSILYLLIPLAMLFALVVGMVLLWAIRSGQYDDLEGPAHRILMDDDDPRIPTTEDDEKDQTSGETQRPEDRPR